MNQIYWYLFSCMPAILVGQPIATTAPATNDQCSCSTQNHMLACAKIVNPHHCNIGSHLDNETTVLVLKTSKELNLNSDWHALSPEQCASLTTYQIVDTKRLDIEADTFANLTSLENVKICDNRYETVRAGTFHGLQQLRSLNLNNNTIRQLEDGAFDDLASLETLELTHNDVKVVPGKIFAPLERLKSLFLFHNNIEELQPDSLTGLRNLNVLDLTYNRLATIRADMFDALPITQLYLSYNQIESIEGDFSSETLEFIYLQNNRLKSVSDSLFSSLVALVDIDISRNKIGAMSNLAFYNCSRIGNINYKDNAVNKPINFQFKASTTKPFVTS